MQQIFTEHLLYAGRFSRCWDTALSETGKNHCPHGTHILVGEVGTGTQRQTSECNSSGVITVYAPVGLKCLDLLDLSTSHKTLTSPKSFCLCGVYLFGISYIKN